MKYTHEDKELNSLLGKNVKIVLFDGKVYTGKLQRDRYGRSRYAIPCQGGTLSFRKTHVIKVEELFG